jgi:CheY-like chemotaxis protein
VKRRPQAGKRRPLRHRLEVINRLGCLYFNDAQQPSSTLAMQDEIRVPRLRSPDRRGLFTAGVNGDVELSLIFRLKQADDAVVLELLPDRPDEDWAHTTSDACANLNVPEEGPASKGAEYSIMARVPTPSAKPDSIPRVLIIDDDVSVTDTFSRMLRLEGYEVWAALSADEGLNLAQTHRPQAVILDLRMPLTSGLQFLRAIRAIPGLTNTPVAIVTGDYYLDDAQSNEIRELGAELRYKPLWLEELVTLARELLNTPVRD